MEDPGADVVERWLDELERRHLADLTFREVRRGVQALSTWYVERRRELRPAAVFGGAGKRAAFALFFTPLHLLTVRRVVVELGLADRDPRRIVDLGCGAGAAAAGWALAGGGVAGLLGIDRNPWAAGEARWNWNRLGLRGRTLQADLGRAELPGVAGAIVAGWSVNELDDAARDILLPRLLAAAAAGAAVLVVEPLARRATPWWGAWSAAVREAGGRDDAWQLPVSLPGSLARLDRAAGLDHGRLTARSLCLSPRRG